MQLCSFAVLEEEDMNRKQIRFRCWPRNKTKVAFIVSTCMIHKRTSCEHDWMILSTSHSHHSAAKSARNDKSRDVPPNFEFKLRDPLSKLRACSCVFTCARKFLSQRQKVFHLIESRLERALNGDFCVRSLSTIIISELASMRRHNAALLTDSADTYTRV